MSGYVLPPLTLYKDDCTVRVMKRRELVRKLNSMGWFPVRQGTERTIPVPRHPEIDEHTARAILREAAKH